jgi:hypothetical protein
MQDKTRFIRAVSQVLQPLTPRIQLPHVITLISALVTYTRSALMTIAQSDASKGGQIDPALVVERQTILDGLQLMKGVCDGIQMPDDGGFLDDEDEEEVQYPPDLIGGTPKRREVEKVEVMEDVDGEMKNTLESARGTLWETVSGILSCCFFDEEVMEV